MSTVSPTISNGPRTTVTWAAMTTSDTGDVISLEDFEGILTFHVVGGGTAQLQRSNDDTNWVSWGSALAANTMNDQSETRAKFLKISTVATATITLIMTARRRNH